MSVCNEPRLGSFVDRIFERLRAGEVKVYDLDQEDEARAWVAA